MPESSSGKPKKSTSTAADRRKPVKIGSPRWVAPVMVALFVIGLVWICAWYIAPNAPVIVDLGFWNMVIGFVFIAGGFLLSTKWR